MNTIDLTTGPYVSVLSLWDALEESTSGWPITGAELAQMLRLSGSSEVRFLVNQARRQGYLIGSNSRGYYRCATAEELAQTIGHLKRRVAGVNAAIAGLESGVNR